MLQITQISNFGSRCVFLSIFPTTSPYKFNISCCISWFPETHCCLLGRRMFQAISCHAAGKILMLVLANKFPLRIVFPGAQFSNYMIFWMILCFTNSKNYLLTENE